MDNPALALHTLNEAAGILRCSPEEVRSLVDKGRLSCVRPGKGKLLVSEAALAAYVSPGSEDPALVLYTPQEAADRLRCEVGLVYDMAKRQRLGHMRRGRNILVSKAHLLEYLAKATIPALDEDQAEAPPGDD